jgi:UPF0716 family protein affecting phage T7 exclusion
MLKWLILSGLTVALIDPILLYAIYTHAGSWTAMAVFFGPILVGNALGGLSRNRAATSTDADPLNAMASMMIAPFARALLWYPGPISSLLGLLLLIPITRKIAMKIALRRVMGAMGGMGGTGGMSGMASGPGGMMWSYGTQTGFPFGADLSSADRGTADRSGTGGFPRAGTPPGNLKQTDARVVDDPPDRPQLPHD